MNTTPVKLLKQTASEWSANGALRLSAALSYYSIFSIAPLLIIAIGLAGWFFGESAAEGHLYEQLKGTLGEKAAVAVEDMVKSGSKPSDSLVATLIGLATLLLGASGVFGQLKDALNTIWGVKAKPGRGLKGFVRERLLSFGMVLAIGFLLLTSLVLSTVVGASSQWIESYLQLPKWFWGSVSLLVSFAVVTLLFATIFKVLPDAMIDWRHVWIGALATALLFEIGKFLLGLYLGRESTDSSFGAAGSVVLLLLWIYYASGILLFGAVFTKVYAAAMGARIRPAPFAELIDPEARAPQGALPADIVAANEPQPRRETLREVLGKASPSSHAGNGQRAGLNLAAALGAGAAIGLALARRRFRIG